MGRNVPRTFAPELPHPVPGEDQGTRGYPITLQVDYEVDPVVTLTLRRGKGRDGREVPCHYSTPQAPTNPELAPKGAYCLIPKAHLEPNTDYTVVAECTDAEGLDDLVRWLRADLGVARTESSLILRVVVGD